MSNVNIKVRLHLPGARVGDVISVDAERADRLVNAKYAVYTDEEATGTYVSEPAPVTSASVSQTAAGPIVELPEDSALKAEWESVAAALGVEYDGLTKAQIIAEVKAAVGND